MGSGEFSASQFVCACLVREKWLGGILIPKQLIIRILASPFSFFNRKGSIHADLAYWINGTQQPILHPGTNTWKPASAGSVALDWI